MFRIECNYFHLQNKKRKKKHPDTVNKCKAIDLISRAPCRQQPLSTFDSSSQSSTQTEVKVTRCSDTITI